MRTPVIKKIVQEELDSLRERIAANIISEGSNATGKTVSSLVVETSDGQEGVRGILYGRPFFGALETGSRPWSTAAKYKRFVPKVFADQIQEWIDAKGLDLNAYAVAHKIIHEGSKLYRDGGRDTIYSREIPYTLDRIQERSLVALQIEVTEQIKLNTK